MKTLWCTEGFEQEFEGSQLACANVGVETRRVVYPKSVFVICAVSARRNVHGCVNM